MFGAKCVVEFSSKVTHVVAAKVYFILIQTGTAKVNTAIKTSGVFVVVPDWLNYSVSRWKKEDEMQYLLEPVYKPLSINVRALLVDDDDERIFSGRWEGKDDVYAKFGTEDWGVMDAEVEQAMLDDEIEDDEWDELDAEIEEGLSSKRQKFDEDG